MGGRIHISAVVPAHNEAVRIGETVPQITTYVDEVLVVDDGSQDRTAAEARACGARVLRQPGHIGYIAAIKRGFQAARGDVIVTLDADGEFPAERIPDLVLPILQNEADMVQARRSRVPRPSERFLTWLANLRYPVGDSGTGFRALRAELARDLDLRGACICGDFSLEVASKGMRIADIPVPLRSVDKRRQVAWYHLGQFFYLLPWLFKSYK